MSDENEVTEDEVSPERKELEERYLKAMAMFMTGSTGSAANTIFRITEGGDPIEIRDFLEEVTGQVREGDLSAPEALLLSQSYTLNRVFHRQMERALNSEELIVREHQAELAFRAQNQCNRTLRTLLEFKNPKRATFIKQQNNMQINQASEENKNTLNPANKILEVNHEARLDPGTSQETIGSNTPLEAVGEDHRAEDGGG